jgi:type VI secretion system protein ImpE
VSTASDLLQEGRLDEAIEALNGALRSRPDDAQSRAFLFELLCFAGNWDRADKQLDILASNDKDKRLGALLYRGALQCERTRHDMAAKPPAPADVDAVAIKGSLNGQAFDSIQDADPRFGARLEVFAGDSYMWLPLEHVSLMEILPPKRLRDLLWIPATIQTGPGFAGADLGQVLLPAITPFSWQDADAQVRLGRVTAWVATEDGREIPLGQKLLLVDGEEFPFLEIRRLEIAQPAQA